MGFPLKAMSPALTFKLYPHIGIVLKIYAFVQYFYIGDMTYVHGFLYSLLDTAY